MIIKFMFRRKSLWSTVQYVIFLGVQPSAGSLPAHGAVGMGTDPCSLHCWVACTKIHVRHSPSLVLDCARLQSQSQTVGAQGLRLLPQAVIACGAPEGGGPRAVSGTRWSSCALIPVPAVPLWLCASACGLMPAKAWALVLQGAGYWWVDSAGSSWRVQSAAGSSEISRACCASLVASTSHQMALWVMIIVYRCCSAVSTVLYHTKSVLCLSPGLGGHLCWGWTLTGLFFCKHFREKKNCETLVLLIWLVNCVVMCSCQVKNTNLTKGTWAPA